MSAANEARALSSRAAREIAEALRADTPDPREMLELPEAELAPLRETAVGRAFEFQRGALSRDGRRLRILLGGRR